MRTAPALQVRLVHFGVWRIGVWLLTLAAALTLVMWIAALRSGPGLVWLAAGAMAIALIVGSGARLARIAPLSLQWDGVGWHIAPLSPPGWQAMSGELSIALDLGAWMLLRFHHDGLGRWSGSTWLPVQRHGLEAQWHALRCAVYSPRPEPGFSP